MDLELQGRIALVTGGSKGIGAAIVRELAREGATVVFCARPSDAMTSLETEVAATGGRCKGISADVFSEADIRSVVDCVASSFGGLDVLINNVGGAIRTGSLMDLTDEDWLRAYELNVLSVVRFTKAALPHLRNSTLRRVINISSISALQPGMYNPHYTTTKAAVVNLSKYLANVLAKEAILVNTVCPGPVYSASWEQNLIAVAQAQGISLEEARTMVDQHEASKVPLGRIGDAREIASAVAFLASPRSMWTTGACLHVNGGKLGAAL